MKQYDYVVIGAGIGGLMFTYQMHKKHPNKTILIIEQGQMLGRRKCPILENKVIKCANCSTCAIMSGFAGAGAFSDAKFNITTEYGGWINEYMNNKDAIFYMQELDRILLNLADKTYTMYEPNLVLKKKALENDLHLLSGDVRHFGTDGIRLIMKRLEQIIIESDNIDYKIYSVKPNDIDINYKTITMSDIDVNYKTVIENKYMVQYNKLIMAVGRSGSEFFKEFCNDPRQNIQTENNQIDIGVRVEVPRIVCKEVSEKIYEPKIKYLTRKHGDIVRTFCFNDGGEVVTENTNGILTVNGHANSWENKKTENSNFAILSTHKFTEPFNEPIEYLNSVARLGNMLGGNAIIAQLLGDLMDGRRSTHKRINEGTIRPTLKSYSPGDLSLVLPSAVLDNVVEMIYQLDKFMPGVANHDTILYGVEAKHYSCKPKFVNKKLFEILDNNVYAIGDGAGVTRSLSQAGATGLYLADKLGNM